ncbi:hypothetical protein [Mycoplasma sp. 327]
MENKNNSKSKWIAILTIYTIFVVLFFIITLLYTQYFLDYEARQSYPQVIKHEEAVAIFWYSGFRATILVLGIILITFSVILYICFKSKIKTISKMNTIIINILFAINIILLSISVILDATLLNAIDVLLWKLKSNKPTEFLNPKHKAISIIYYENLEVLEAFLFLSSSLFVILSFFKIYYFASVIHKNYLLKQH